jgi:hypothetical protein
MLLWEHLFGHTATHHLLAVPLGRGKDCNDQKIIRMMGDRLGMASQKMTLSHLQVSVFWVADMYRSGGNGNSGEF